MNQWKILFVGVGSIAKRHIRNFTKLLNDQNENVVIDVFRSGRGVTMGRDIEEMISQSFSNYSSVPSDYDVVFITNPTNLHFDTLLQFHEKGKHFFIEKPFCSIDQLCRFQADLFKNDKVYYVASPLIYTNIIKYIKNNIDIKKIKSIRSICSSYLPDWRPDVDYRDVYSARREMGGGVSIDLIHEWDYIYYLFGEPSIVYSIIRKVSNLEIDSDDIAVYIAEYPDKIVELHLDYFGKTPIRKIELFTDEDVIVCDFIKNTIIYKKEQRNINLEQKRDDYQIEELKYFINMINSKKCGAMEVEKSIKILKIASGVKK